MQNQEFNVNKQFVEDPDDLCYRNVMQKNLLYFIKAANSFLVRLLNQHNYVYIKTRYTNSRRC